MSKPTDVRVRETRFASHPLPYRAPLKFGGRIVAGVEIMDVEIDVENQAGLRASGFGSMPLGSVWAWPSDLVEPGVAATAVRTLAEKLTAELALLAMSGHPLDLIRELHPSYFSIANKIKTSLQLAEPIPPLAVLLAASPIDAALHDAFGRVNGINTYNALSKEFVATDLARDLGAPFTGEYLDQYTLRQPKSRIPLYHLVGAMDPLTEADVTKSIGDGLPESLPDWILRDQLSHLKIKLNGEDLAWDLGRVAAVESTAAAVQEKRGCERWVTSLDFNEKCENVEYVLEFLAKLKEISPSAFQRVQYIEQPTHRDLRRLPINPMHAAAKIKPVVIDESLVDLESLTTARELGYSGVALKSCKGQTEALLMAAAAQKFGMFLCVQDLTCPGASFLQSAELAARLPTASAIEGNARQFCPAGNVGWAERYPQMFRIQDGCINADALTEPGLGHSPPPDA